jgi:uncharacterized coiled-coil protein SlyX
MDIVTHDRFEELEKRISNLEKEIANINVSLQPSIHRKLGSNSSLNSMERRLKEKQTNILGSKNE